MESKATLYISAQEMSNFIPCRIDEMMRKILSVNSFDALCDAMRVAEQKMEIIQIGRN